jgi:putative MFS transporter
MQTPHNDVRDQIGSPVGRLDRLPVTSFQIFWVTLLGFGYLVETFDNIVFSYLAPAVRSEWKLTIGQIGLVTSAVFVGMLIGAVGGGRLSDRIGRKPVLIGASVFYSLTSLMSALAPNFEVLLASRVLTGVGVQAATGVIMVYVSEMFPRTSRGRFLTAMTFFGFVASPLTAIAALSIAPSGPGAWRWVFALGTVGVLIAVAVALWLPETVRWLTLHGREQHAEAIVGRLEAAATRRGLELPPVVTGDTGAAHASFRELLRPKHARAVVVLGVTFAMLVFCLYGFVSWIPTVLVGRGLTQTDALRIATYISFGPMLAPPVLFVLADRIERKTALLWAAIVGCGAFIVFGATTNAALTIGAGVLVEVALSCASISFYTYIPEVFPTAVRGVGAGVVNGIGRVAGIVSGLAVAALYSALGPAKLYIALGAGLVLMGIIIAIAGPRTTRKSLEVIS